MISSQFLR